MLRQCHWSGTEQRAAGTEEATHWLGRERAPADRAADTEAKGAGTARGTGQGSEEGRQEKGRH